MGFLIKKPAEEEGKALPAILIGIFVAFGGILFGYASQSSNTMTELFGQNSHGI